MHGSSLCTAGDVLRGQPGCFVTGVFVVHVHRVGRAFACTCMRSGFHVCHLGFAIGFMYVTSALLSVCSLGVSSGRRFARAGFVLACSRYIYA